MGKVGANESVTTLYDHKATYKPCKEMSCEVQLLYDSNSLNDFVDDAL
jgi:hypothetical protein